MAGLHLQWVLTMLTAVTLAAVALVLATWSRETAPQCGGWVCSDVSEIQWYAMVLLPRIFLREPPICARSCGYTAADGQSWRR